MTKLGPAAAGYGPVVRRMFTAKVKDGVIVAEGVELPEGEIVTVLVDRPTNGDDGLTDEEAAELEESEAALERGEGLRWEDLRAEQRVEVIAFWHARRGSSPQ